MALSPDGKHFLCCGLHKASNPLGAVNEPIVLQYEWDSQKKIRTHVADGVRGIAWRVMFLSNDSFVVASGGSGGGFLLFWQADKEKEAHKIKMKNTARGLDLHPDGLHLATVHHDRIVRVSSMSPKQEPKAKKA